MEKTWLCPEFISDLKMKGINGSLINSKSTISTCTLTPSPQIHQHCGSTPVSGGDRHQLVVCGHLPQHIPWWPVVGIPAGGSLWRVLLQPPHISGVVSSAGIWLQPLLQYSGEGQETEWIPGTFYCVRVSV